MEEDIIQNLNTRIDRAIERSKEALSEDDLKKVADDVRIKSETMIRKHPYKAILGGLVVGYLVAKLFDSED